LWGQTHIRAKNEKNIEKKLFSLLWSLSYFAVVFFEMLFSSQLKNIDLEKPVNGSLHFSQGFLFTGSSTTNKKSISNLKTVVTSYYLRKS